MRTWLQGTFPVKAVCNSGDPLIPKLFDEELVAILLHSLTIRTGPAMQMEITGELSSPLPKMI
jgi:hypothetical protein